MRSFFVLGFSFWNFLSQASKLYVATVWYVEYEILEETRLYLIFEFLEMDLKMLLDDFPDGFVMSITDLWFLGMYVG